MQTPTGLSDYIPPEDRERLRQRAIDRRWAMISWVITLLIGLVMMALFVPM